ncbi:MAG TPA: hypothetical protein VKZ78_04050 [Sphingobacteriaceae bacterium]|nr:hypothetical protein [Sphingobacteriaceae bacterium]
MTGKLFRVLIAYIQTVLLVSIVGSGMLFMHKHTTSSGQIIIHIHPYNLKSDPDGTKHKHSENEIHFLDVVFNGTYIQTKSLTFDASVWGDYVVTQSVPTVSGVSTDFNSILFLRGPPQYV